MVISNEKVVSLIYQLRVNEKDGKIVETVTHENPLTFIFGVGNLLPKFEDNIQSLKVGDSFNFSLTSEDAYGEFNDKAIVEVPLSTFLVDGKVDNEMLSLGNMIAMRDQDDNRLNGVVKNIGSEFVTMDFNHALAGETLFFSGTVAGIRDATADELEHGHVHSSGGCGGGGGCGCEGGNGNCDSQEGHQHEHDHGHSCGCH